MLSPCLDASKLRALRARHLMRLEVIERWLSTQVGLADSENYVTSGTSNDPREPEESLKLIPAMFRFTIFHMSRREIRFVKSKSKWVESASRPEGVSVNARGIEPFFNH